MERYIIIDQRKNGDMFNKFYETEAEAISAAQSEWDNLTKSEKDKVEYFNVIKSTHCDPDDPALFDGDIICEWK